MLFPPKLSLSLPEYVSTAELAAAMGVSANTIRRWAQSGILPLPVIVSHRIRRFNTTLVRKRLAQFFPELLQEGSYQEGTGTSAAEPAAALSLG